MPDYSKGKIYTIRFTNDNEIYVGSTIQPLSVRFGEHKRKNDSAVYKYIYDKYDGDFKNCYIELYENYPCESKEELHKKEGEITRLIGTLNNKIAGRTKQEYNKENKEILNKISKEYYENNKEILNEKAKEYREKNKEIINEKRRDFYKNNKEIVNEINKEYYGKNKEIVNEKRKEKIICECGCEITKSSLFKHLKSKNHTTLLDLKLEHVHQQVV